MAITEPSYTIVYPPRLDKLKSLDEGLPTLPSNRLLGIQHRIRNITEKTLRGKTRNCLKDLVTVLDSVHFHIMQSYGYPMRDQKTLLEWKFGLENLRCTLVGVKVDCSISDTVFTYSQMFFFTVEAVEGLQDNGKTYIHFSGIDDWPINEELKRRFPLKIGQSYRLLTPKKIDFTIPPGQAQWKTSSVGKQLFFHIIHEGMTAEESFVYNKRIEVALGPLQVVELLTPIVRMIPEEEIVVRITNLTRDSVKDTLKIVDSLAYSEDKVFILNEKHSTSLDTIRIHWRTQPEDGTYVISLEIGGLDHFYFIARKFHAEVDRDKRIGIVSAADNSPIQDALHRLKVSYIVVELDSTFAEKIDAVDVLIIDSRVVTMSPTIHDYHEQLNRFVTQGGHLVILSQDASAWNTEPLWAGIQLTSTVLFDEDIPIEMDVNHPLFTYPNRINPEDWNGWIVRRGFNIISGSLLNETDILASTKGEDMPLIISKKEGDGNRTYIDLALDFQWMNINPGAFRLLANLISY